MRIFCIAFILACVARAIVIEGSTREVIEHTKAHFGPGYQNMSRISFHLLNLAISGGLVVADPLNACGPLTVNMTGKIGLAIRDQSTKNCSFVDKILHVRKV